MTVTFEVRLPDTKHTTHSVARESLTDTLCHTQTQTTTIHQWGNQKSSVKSYLHQTHQKPWEWESEESGKLTHRTPEKHKLQTHSRVHTWMKDLDFLSSCAAAEPVQWHTPASDCVHRVFKRRRQFVQHRTFKQTVWTLLQELLHKHRTTCLTLTLLQAAAAAACKRHQRRRWFRTGALSWTGLSYRDGGAANSLLQGTSCTQVQYSHPSETELYLAKLRRLCTSI